MDNPFTPNFGSVPVDMAGRETLISEMVDAFKSRTFHPSLTTIYIGARGTGKTALLTALAERAECSGWISVNVSSISGILDDIAVQTAQKATNYIDEQDKRRLTGFSVGSLLELSWENTGGAPSTWRSSMTEVIEALNEKSIGLLITVDEVDPKLEEMTQLVSIYQHFVRENRKVSLLMAGLPHKVSQLLNGNTVSFLRRASQHKLGNIDDYEVEASLRKTIQESEKSIGQEALSMAVRSIGGFPYMMQLVAYRMWEAAGSNKTISKNDVAHGIEMAENDMRTRVLKSTLDELSDTDLLFLQAMLEDESVSTLASVEANSGKKGSFASTYKRRLLERGVIQMVKRNGFEFALPGLRDYLPTYIEDSFDI